MPKPHYAHKRRPEAGNVFIIILVGIVLFASLSFFISRSMRSDTTSMMSGRKAEIVATEIIAYAKKVESGVNRLRRKGVSESDISFDAPQWGFTSYQHSPPQPDEHKVFHPDGGNIQFQDLSEYGMLTFTGVNVVDGIGNCHTTANTACKELLFMFVLYSLDVCKAINKNLLGSDRVDTDSNFAVSEYSHPYQADNSRNYVGIFPTGSGSAYKIDSPYYAGKPAGCVIDHDPSDIPVFYYTLIAR